MRKGRDFLLVGQLLLMFWTMRMTSPAFASSIQVTSSRPPLAHAALARSGWHRHRRHSCSYGWQEQNQYVRVIANNTNNKSYRGHDQGNSGNQGDNRGYDEDNSGNAANQIINRRSIRYSRNNQHLQIISNNSGNIFYFGYRQGNTGNSGYNHGYNRDDSGNSGNQIIN